MVDSSVANSSGYFKDPVTKEDFSVDTPRCVECKLENGKFTWPMVMTSAGDPVKIVYKYFTDEEKDLYKAYRGRPSTGSSVRKHVEKKVPVQVEDIQTVEPEHKAKEVYDPKSARSRSTDEIISSCDMYLGVSYMDGIPYAILGKKGSSKNIQWHIPRSLIKDDEMKRLCAGTV